MKKCPQCERMLPDDAQQCSFCGEVLENSTPEPARKEPVTDIEEDTTQVDEPVRKTREQEPVTIVQREKSNNGLLYGIIGALSALIALGLIWFFLLRPNQEAKTADPAMNEETPELIDNTAQEEAAPATEEPMVSSQQSDDDFEKAVAAMDDETNCYLGQVRVTGNDVRLRKTPEINDRNIIKDRRGKNLHPKKGEVLPCIDAAGDFFYVDFHGMPCYISNKFAILIEDE